jgi:hypothetical protein
LKQAGTSNGFIGKTFFFELRVVADDHQPAESPRSEPLGPLGDRLLDV